MQLSQHSWYPEFDCAVPGQCPTEVDAFGARRPIVYSSLFDHALYTTASPLELYRTVGGGNRAYWPGGTCVDGS